MLLTVSQRHPSSSIGWRQSLFLSSEAQALRSEIGACEGTRNVLGSDCQKHQAAGAFTAHYISLYGCSGYAVIPFDVDVGPVALASTKRSFFIWSKPTSITLISMSGSVAR